MMNNTNASNEIPKPDASDHLETTLTLKIKCKEFNIPGANIKDCQLDCSLYGFQGSLKFSIPDDEERDKRDELITEFMKECPISVKMNIMPVFNLPDPPPKPFPVNAMVTDKTVREEIYEEVNKPAVLYRHYSIEFADAAQVLWKQHYPFELYVDQCMDDVFKAQQTADITLNTNLPALKVQHKMICLGLSFNDDLNNGTQHHYNRANFYDFLISYVSAHNAHFHYDYKSNQYSISADRPPPEDTCPFLPQDVNRVTTYWPETERHQVEILNATIKNPRQETLSHGQSIEGIKHSQLLREELECHYTAFKDNMQTKLKTHGENLDIHFSKWPVKTFIPGSKFRVNCKVWSKDPMYAKKEYRAYRFQIHYSPVNEKIEHDIQDKSTAYKLLYKVQAELDTCEKPRLPEYTPTAYPVQVQGKVVSTIGAKETDKTYDFEKDPDTGHQQYKVYIPLWDKTILVKRLPDTLNPHLYFPHYRNTKLLLDLDLYEPTIARVLDWGDRVELPLATQGNHILFGKNKDDETSMQHIYEGDKPALLIKRMKEKDNEQVKLREGKLTLETNWEEATLEGIEKEI